jgi:CRISPR-associated protein Cas5d
MRVSHVIEVWGDFACFTRPELKVERFSYPVPTPSAVRGIFDAIYCKPKEFHWQITRVDCLGPPSYIALRRNEVKGTASVSSIAKWMSGKAEPEPLWADGDEEGVGRTQRQTMALRKVRYRLYGEICPWPGFEAQAKAFDEQFQRRAAAGKCVWQPYLGCREFVAYFAPVDPPPGPPCPGLDLDVGLMLYDVFDLSRPGGPEDAPAISLFRAQVRDGVLPVPDYASPEVLKQVRSQRL